MKALVLYDSKNAKVEEIQTPQVTDQTVKIKVKYAGICGTDLHEYSHKTFVTANQMVLGHEFSGEVVEVGAGVGSVTVGSRVAVEPIWGCGECSSCQSGNYNTCVNMKSYGLHENGGFAKYVVVDQSKVFELPDELSYDLAALVEPTAVVVHAIRRSAFKFGDRVAVFGAGPIGLLLSESLRAAGASQVIVVEVSEKRRELAKEMGADVVIDPTKEDAVKRIKELTGKGVDVAYDAAGVEATFNSSLDSVKPNGDFMIVSVFSEPISYNPAMQLISEKTISTSLGYNHIFGEVIDLLAKGSIKAEKVITSKIALDDIVEGGFEKLIVDKSESKILVDPSL
ncbi:2,3-butanediol dehydrogenase [Aquisalibacillus elongatus]|uniref:(R,R)-butanediol dehydrogenase/meso-butanediol dehydrogenase/diacetyl reductase n=1 Tax=Aquisalibacillus elongatus TaxID=485577 RepID=A0A3N5C1K6_9BACI|nr:2,3-butanediol dehydrogenase [Aquisalibacillus elongatus]RPF50061.1 (R,R)-butanediol dehydrogenase/meso-butanediol dehydrogenase/diacetyl reductase [Aquisalibacillus elongatus]